MLETSKDLRERILEHLFPDLRYGGDPDIERYFELRTQNRTIDALTVYKNRLVPRYPDQDKRLVLLRLYRQHSPQYPILLKNLLLERANDLIVRIKANIDTLVVWTANVDMKNTYAVLKAMEHTARLLPDNQDKARDFAKNYQEYASILEYRQKEFNRLCYLLDEFYSQTSSDTTEATDFLAMSQASEEARLKKEAEANRRNFFDLSRINFDKTDIQRIEIPASISRNEDKALAYCFKYWLKIHDSAFERIIWLYSRKYNSLHYQIFKTIKVCRLRKYSDDEILSMVTSCITTEYSYTVQGDIYMQQAWKQLKARLMSGGKVSGPAEQPNQARQAGLPKPANRLNSSRQGKTTLSDKNGIVAGSAKIKNTAAATGVQSSDTSPVKTGKTRHDRTRKAVPPHMVVRQTAEPRLQPARQPKKKTGVNKLAMHTKYSPGLMPTQLANGSISDFIKKLSGRAYDVYRDVFFAKLRPVIREELTRNRIKGYSLFDDSLTKAENTIYDFMEKNYYNTFMDWSASDELAELRQLGFNLETMDSIIEKCYSKLPH